MNRSRRAFGITIAAATLALTGCAITSGQSSVGEYVDDTALTARVKAKLAEDERVSAMRVNVDTMDSVVHLSGFATSQAEKNRAAEVARAVPGVKSVRNNLVVRAPER